MPQKEKEVLLTVDGLKRLEAELECLKSIKRKEVADRIKQAISFGDISENSEYEEAKNEQAFVEGRILTLEKTLRNAKVIDDEDSNDASVVGLGSWVQLRDLENSQEVEYEIVGSLEADPANSRISNESPLGKAVLGQKTGSIIEINVPAGLLRYEITGVRKH